MPPADSNPFESILGALRDPEDASPAIEGARCPSCHASDFVKASDLYSENPEHEAFERVRPPRRRSATGRVVAVTLPLAAASFWAFTRFGGLAGQLVSIGSGVIVIVVALTSIRRLSDDYYERRQLWNRLYVCRRCGQLVKG